MSKAVVLPLLLLALAAPARAYDIWGWLTALAARPGAPVTDSSQGRLRVDVVAEGLASPWGLAFLPDGRVLVTERPGRIVALSVNGGRALLADVPQVAYREREGQGGLLDIALHPDFASNRLVYLAFTVDTPQGEMTRVARYVLDRDRLTQERIVFAGVPGSAKSKHFGCRLAFDPGGRLLVTLGERGDPRRAQDLADLNGKTLRLNDDGTTPEDNPFAGVAGARPEIYAYGNRNAQGMAVHPATGMIVQTEHGPSWNDAPGGGDEINIVRPGTNYGWPLVHHRETGPGLTPPVLEYTPAVAPSGACFLSGGLFPAWEHDFFFATLRGEKLIRVKFAGERPVEQEFLLQGRFGRLRHVACGPDGALYVLTSDTDAYGPGRTGGDRLLRLSPAG